MSLTATVGIEDTITTVNQKQNFVDFTIHVVVAGTEMIVISRTATENYIAKETNAEETETGAGELIKMSFISL